MKLTVAASGAADPDVVWDRYVHPARWSDWSPQIRSVDYPDPTIAAGGRGTVHGPCGVGVAFEILAVDHEKRCWAWRVTVAGITLMLGHDVCRRRDPAAGPRWTSAGRRRSSSGMRRSPGSRWAGWSAN